MNAPNYQRTFTSDVVAVNTRAPVIIDFATDYNRITMSARSGVNNKSFMEKLIAETKKARFVYRLNRWKKETASLSSPSEIARHHLLQELVAYGEYGAKYAISRLLLGDRHIHIFLILNQVYKFNAFTPHQAGKPHEMAAAWIDWFNNKQAAA